MITVIGTHEVKDVRTWKAGFDSNETNRTKRGVKLVGVYSSLTNPNRITICMDMPSKEVFESMINDPEMQRTMSDSGVIGKPEYVVLTSI